MREFETEDFVAGMGPAIRVQKEKSQNEVKEAPKKMDSTMVEDGVDMSKIRHWTMASSDDYPAYLYQIGRRLTTFARLVVQFASTLHRDFDVPVEIKVKSCFFILILSYF